MADSNRVDFDGLEAPKLLPDNLVSISSSDTEFPFETLGVVPVQSICDINVTYAANVPGSGVYFKATVADMGEGFDGQQKKCQILSTAAAFRIPAGMREVVDKMSDSSELWRKHYVGKGGNMPGAPIWQTVATGLALDKLGNEMNEMESSVVESTRLRGQPIAPYWSSTMVEDYSLGKAELKAFFSSKPGMTWQIMMPHQYFE